MPEVYKAARRNGPAPSAGSQYLARRRRWIRRIAVLAFFAIGLAGVGGGGWLVYRELARPATHAEAAAAGQAEIAARWERLTAGQIFPATVRYTTSTGLTISAYRAGIAPPATCPAALDPLPAAALDRQGCSTVLRATYTDASHAFVLTTGIAVMPGATAAHRAVTNSLLADLRHAWRTTKGKGVTVAVVGGDVDSSVAGLTGKGKVVTGPTYGHLGQGQVTEGTLFASAVAANGPSPQNPFGTLGLAPQARILSLSVQSNLKTPAWLADVGRAIQYAVGHGAKVIYVEQTSYSNSARLAAAVADAVANNVVVASAEYGPAKLSGAPQYPASLPGVIDAASVDLPGWPAPPSELPAPANGSILVAAPGNVLHVSGPAATSYPVYNFFAAGAWLTATAALIKSAYPGLADSLVARALALSARDRPAGGYSVTAGFGLINPAGALTEAAKLAKLRTAAAPGPAVVSPSAGFAPGSAPGAVQAVRHSVWKLAGYSVLMLAGLIVIFRARRMRRRWRRRARMPTAQSHRIARDGAQPAPEPVPPVAGTAEAP